MLFNCWVLHIVRKCMLDRTKGCLYMTLLDIHGLVFKEGEMGICSVTYFFCAVLQ